MKQFNKIFPEEIISDILSRLPAKSVLECKSVCKTWKDLIQQPTFRKMHLAHLNRPDSHDSGQLRYVSVGNYDLYCFEFNENEDWNYANPILKRIMFETKCEDYNIIVGSFNGLICIYETASFDSHGPATITNPVTREYVVLPDFDKSGYYHEACGFGYLAETNEYKVVRIYKRATEPNVVEVEVYTLGSGKGWRHVGKFGLGFRFYTYDENTHGVFLNGCLHWRNPEGGMVLVFDLAQEKFRDHIPPPPMLKEGFDDIHDFSVIGVSGGGILYYAVCQFDEGEKFDHVWLLMKKDDNHVMGGKEEQQSWVWSQPDSLEQTEPFAFRKQDSVLRYGQGNIQVFCAENSTWTNLGDFSEISLQVFPHKHTLISLKELGEEDAKVMKSCGIEETYSSESGRD